MHFLAQSRGTLLQAAFSSDMHFLLPITNHLYSHYVDDDGFTFQDILEGIFSPIQASSSLDIFQVEVFFLLMSIDILSLGMGSRPPLVKKGTFNC